MPSGEFPSIHDLRPRMDELARAIAAIPRGHPRRFEMVEELARLNILAESMTKKGK